MLGSNKINGTCPAMMKVEIKDNCVQVKHVKTHIRHSTELGSLKLSEEEKKDIALKLENKIPVSAIMDDIRDSVTDKLERIHLLTRKDVLNIKSTFGIHLDSIMDRYQ